MYKPGWTRFHKPGGITAPPAWSYEIDASPNWHASNRTPADIVATNIMNPIYGLIAGFVEGQRHNAFLSGLQVYRARQALSPFLRVDYMNIHGHEMVKVICMPEGGRTSVPTTIPVSPGSVIKITQGFHGWPIPGSKRTGDNACALVNFDEAQWFVDFASAPGMPKQRDPIKFQWFPEGSSGRHWNDGSIDYPVDGTWPEQVWQNIQAGSKFVNTQLSGAQYWEVLVTKLPTDVPRDDTFSLPGWTPDQGLGGRQYTVRGYEDASITKVTYPPDMNTWQTPLIGVLPKRMVDPTNQDFTPATIGRDPDINKPRSIGLMPICYGTDHKYTMAITGDDYFIGYRDGRLPPHGMLPADTIPPARRHEIGHFVLQDCIIYANGVIVSPYISGSSYIYGPGPGCTFRQQAGGDCQWEVIGQLGGSVRDDPNTFTYHTPAVDSIIHDQLPATYGDLFGNNNQGPLIFNNGRVVDIPEDYPAPADNYFCPPNAKPGKYSVVLKGRRDMFGVIELAATGGRTVFKDDYTAYGPDEELPMDADFGETGFWTGVEMGEIKEGDRFMVATRVAGKGKSYIWFGKNGDWYSRDGNIGNTALTPDNATALLDADEQGKVEYYAAMSWLVGPFEGKILLGGAQKYQQPGGFTRLTTVSDFTIPGPDKTVDG